MITHQGIYDHKHRYIVVSYYTPEYGDYAKRLAATCEQHGVPHEIAPRNSAGSWQRNCALKAEHLLNCAKRYSGRAIVWIDADATIEAYPRLFDQYVLQPFDIAVRTSNTDPPHPWNRVLSGTVYLNPTKNRDRLLSRWWAQCTLNPVQWDQVSLAVALENHGGVPYKVEPLPEHYCAVHDRRTTDTAAVVLHWQASRAMKPIVGDEE